MVKSVFSLEYKDEKLLIVELTLGKCDLILLWRVRSESTSSNPLPSWEMCGVNGENGERGTDFEESSPCFRNEASWSDYIGPLKSSFKIH